MCFEEKNLIMCLKEMDILLKEFCWFWHWICFFREVKRVSIQENWEHGEREHIYLSKLQKFFATLDFANEKEENKTSDEIMKEHFGFNIEVKDSSIKDAGRGVFVKDGMVPKFSITSLYPGWDYYILFILLFNRCKYYWKTNKTNNIDYH